MKSDMVYNNFLWFIAWTQQSDNMVMISRASTIGTRMYTRSLQLFTNHFNSASVDSTQFNGCINS